MTPYFEQDGIVIYHGDCREVLPTLTHQHVDVVITDPPFSIPVKYHDAEGEYPRSWGDICVMEPFFSSVFRELQRVCKPRAQVYVCCDGQSYPVFFKAALPMWSQSHLLIWYKPSGRRGRGWQHSHEEILHLRNPQTEYADGFRQDLIGIMPVRTLEREHPAEKPGSLWEWLFEAVPANYVRACDPFMGSGELLVVARQRGIQAVGIEIEERYCEIAAKRLAQGGLPLEMGA